MTWLGNIPNPSGDNNSLAMSNILWHNWIGEKLWHRNFFWKSCVKIILQKYSWYITRSPKMRKVSPCPVCQMEFSSYKEFKIHFRTVRNKITEHREWQRVQWRTQNNKRSHPQRRLDQGGILKIRRNVTLPGFGSCGPIKNQWSWAYFAILFVKYSRP